MHRMIGKVYKSKKVCDIVRHSEDIKVAMTASNHITHKHFSNEIFPKKFLKPQTSNSGVAPYINKCKLKFQLTLMSMTSFFLKLANHRKFTFAPEFICPSIKESPPCSLSFFIQFQN